MSLLTSYIRIYSFARTEVCKQLCVFSWSRIGFILLNDLLHPEPFFSQITSVRKLKPEPYLC